MIRTFTGRSVDPFNMRAEDIDIVDIAHALSMICRYGGHVSQFYSVAEHSCLVSFSLPRELALWGLLHDAGEAYLGDIPTPIKTKIHREREDAVMLAVIERFNLDPNVMPFDVHRADKAILADEMFNMMGGHKPHDTPLGVKIHNWSPEQAKRNFLIAFQDLTSI
jgi:hypothetical protein